MSVFRVNLADRLADIANAGATSGAQFPKGAAPSGWEPGVKYDATGAMTVTTAPVPQVHGEADWHRLISDLGARVPQGWRVRLDEARFDPAAWTREAEGEDAVTRPVWRYRFKIEPAGSTVNADELLDVVAKWKPAKANTKPVDDGCAFVVAYADTQIGKPDGDGTEGTVHRILTKTDAAVARLKLLRKMGRQPARIVIALLGDHIEGFNSQGGRLAWRNELTLTEMVRVWRRTLLHIVKTFADFGLPVTVVVIPGNHDEAVRTGDIMATRYDDSWAIDAASAVADTLTEVGFDHVGFVFPGRDELTVTLDVAGTIVGFAHGHQTRGKAMTWWANQSHGMQPVGSATLLLTGHFHHLKVEQSGIKTWMQAPALDGGSTWFRHGSGADAPAGLITLTVGNGGWDDLAIL